MEYRGLFGKSSGEKDAVQYLVSAADILGPTKFGFYVLALAKQREADPEWAKLADIILKGRQDAV